MPNHCTLLYAESDAELARQFQRRIEAHDIDAFLVASDMAGISALSQHRFDLLVANYRLNGGSGLAVLRAARKSHPELAALLLIEPDDLKHAGPALREEGYDYLVKDADGIYLDQFPVMAPRLMRQQHHQSALDSLAATLEQEQALALQAANSNRNGLAIFGADLCLRLCNTPFLRFFGHPDNMGARGTPMGDLLRLDTAPEQAERLLMQQSFRFEQESQAGLLHEVSGSRSADGGLVLTYTDISSSTQAERLNWRQTNIDALTGLPGRALFMELLKHQVQRGSRCGYNGAALLLLDLDGFRELNQTHGSAVCDLLLVEVARRLADAVRESDVVGRMGGDQFGVLVVDVNTSENVEIVAGKLLAAMAKPFIVHSANIRITASLGIAFHPAELHGAAELVQMVEDAVSHAKAAGKNRYKFA
jgi:diguanylate cyclase (GGDEF)-like protein